MATGGLPMCSSRLARPATWVWKISSQRSRELLLAARHERMGVDRPQQARPAAVWPARTARGETSRSLRRERSESPKLLVRCRSARSRSRSTSADQQRVVALEARRLGQQRAVLGDQAMAAEDDVGRRFADAAGGVDVGGDAAARLVDDELAAIGGLADDLVAGRQVDEHRRAGEGLEGAGRDRHPQVLADLDADDDAGHAARPSKSRSVPNGDVPMAVPIEHASARLPCAGREPAGLVELLVIRQERLGHDAEQLPVLTDGGDVEELIVDEPRQADDGQARERCSLSSSR